MGWLKPTQIFEKSFSCYLISQLTSNNSSLFFVEIMSKESTHTSSILVGVGGFCFVLRLSMSDSSFPKILIFRNLTLLDPAAPNGFPKMKGILKEPLRFSGGE